MLSSLSAGQNHGLPATGWQISTLHGATLTGGSQKNVVRYVHLYLFSLSLPHPHNNLNFMNNLQTILHYIHFRLRVSGVRVAACESNNSCKP
jgi:hypothetical protein